MAVRLHGKGVSDGLFLGPIRHIDKEGLTRLGRGDPAAERLALEEAIAAAIAELSDLMAKADDEGAAILGFQIAMLEDETLAEPARAAIADGEAADEAWRRALAPQISGYEASDDDYFRARAADLCDLRDRVLRHLSGATTPDNMTGVVLAGQDIAPSRLLETDWSGGGAIVLAAGSVTSHAAMLARARGIPMVIGTGTVPPEGCMAAVDGLSGTVVIDPDEPDVATFASRKAEDDVRRQSQTRLLRQPACRRSGQRIELLINVSGIAELDQVDPAWCDGIGLMRSEFLFRDGALLPDEDAQYEAYRHFVTWAAGRPVTIRTLDIGGDKPIAGLTPEGETNPFLGLRGVRLTLARPDVFRTQLRALARAATHGPLKVMLPMVTVPDELGRTATLLEECVAELEREGRQAQRPDLGIMVEVPAVALAPDLFHEAAFLSIGSNDLTQYVMAAARDDQRVSALNDCGHPAVTRLIASVAAFGRARGIPVSLCGDMASEPAHLKSLLDAGLTSLSVAPARLARIKAALADL